MTSASIILVGSRVGREQTDRRRGECNNPKPSRDCCRSRTGRRRLALFDYGGNGAGASSFCFNRAAKHCADVPLALCDA
jgi:hypothetical protein